MAVPPVAVIGRPALTPQRILLQQASSWGSLFAAPGPGLGPFWDIAASGASTATGSGALASPLHLLSLSRLGAQYALDMVTGRSGGQGLRTTYLALLTAAPTDAYSLAQVAGVETTMTGYSRQAVSWTAPSAADPSETHNASAINFGPLSGTIQPISHLALVSAASGSTGDFVVWAALLAPVTPISGQSLQIAPGGLSFLIPPGS